MRLAMRMKSVCILKFGVRTSCWDRAYSTATVRRGGGGLRLTILLGAVPYG